MRGKDQIPRWSDVLYQGMQSRPLTPGPSPRKRGEGSPSQPGGCSSWKSAIASRPTVVCVPANWCRTINYRHHPDNQIRSLHALYQEIGFARSLLAYELPEGRLKLIDGHLRRELDPNMEVEVFRPTGCKQSSMPRLSRVAAPRPQSSRITGGSAGPGGCVFATAIALASNEDTNCWKFNSALGSM